MKIAVITPELMGHLNPACELTRELCALGHDAVLVTRNDGLSRTRAQKLGVAHVTYGFKRDWLDEERAELGRHTGLRSVSAASEYMLAANRELMHGGLDKAIALERFDAVIADEMLKGACLVAARRSMPYATFCAALSMSYDPLAPPPIFDWQPRHGRLGRLRDAAGWALLSWLTRRAWRELETTRKRWHLPLVNSLGEHVYLGRAQVAQQPPWFDFPRVYPPPFLATGPWVTSDQEDAPFPWQWLDGRPLTYACMSSAARIDAEDLIDLRPPGHQLVISAAGQRTHLLTQDVLIVPWAPNYALIQRADNVITHGGLNTTLAALLAGKPITTLPQAFEQPGVAARVSRAQRTRAHTRP